MVFEVLGSSVDTGLVGIAFSGPTLLCLTSFFDSALIFFLHHCFLNQVALVGTAIKLTCMGYCYFPFSDHSFCYW